jgi:3-dehydroquinate synthase
MAEAIKVAILDSPDFFGFLDEEAEHIRRRSTAHMTHVVGTSTKLKMKRIAEDPYEEDLRRPLNFGHTLGHPIETEFGYRGMRHGEAVAIGMGVATCIALEQNLIDSDAAERIFSLLARYDLLGYQEPIRPDSVIEHMRVVKLIRGKRLHFVLPTRIGGVLITEDLGDQGDGSRFRALSVRRSEVRIMNALVFDLATLVLDRVRAHGGEGEIGFRRLFRGDERVAGMELRRLRGLAARNLDRITYPRGR